MMIRDLIIVLAVEQKETFLQSTKNYLIILFIDAVKELSNRAGIKINFEQTSNNKDYDKHLKILEISTKWFEENLKVENNLCRKYLHNRKLSDETIEHF